MGVLGGRGVQEGGGRGAGPERQRVHPERSERVEEVAQAPLGAGGRDQRGSLDNSLVPWGGGLAVKGGRVAGAGEWQR